MMRNWSVPVGHIFGVEVRLHLSFFLLLIFVGVTETAVPHGTSVERAFALVAIVFGSVLLHELGHALAALHGGLRARAIVLLPIGGVTLLDETEKHNSSPLRELRISLAGPMVNLLIGFVSGAILLSLAPEIGLWQRPLVHSGALLRSLVWVNILMGAFNLLPAYPLDGGGVLRAVLARTMGPIRATHRAVMIGQAFSLVFIFIGIFYPWLMLVGFFLFVGGQIEERSAVFSSVLETVTIEDVMLTDFSTLSPADTLSDALHKAVHSLQDDFPVIRGSDLVGVISRHKILEELRSSGNGYVQSAMNQLFEVSQPKETLGSAFRKITRRGSTLLPVVDGERLVGIVTLQNLMHSMSLLAETRKLRKGLGEPGT